jgi:alkylhydroperoxidase family enzyme
VLKCTPKIVQWRYSFGFKDVKARVLNCLHSGAILHAERANIDVKNLLATGEVDVENVAAIISRARGSDYECSPHHRVASVDVHIINVRYRDRNWYIKWYFLDPDSVFISVHN